MIVMTVKNEKSNHRAELSMLDEGMNAVRGLAALAVVFAHAVQVFIARITGTDNFFVIATGQIASQSV